MRWLAVILLVSACAGGGFDGLNHYFQKKGITPPNQTEFQSCRAYGCQKIDTIALTKKEWKLIEKPFRTRSKSSEEEREKIAQAIASFEQIVGEINGTSEDVRGTFQQTGHWQQDCVDESTNTSIYLKVLEARENLTFHTVSVPQSRVPFMRWPHQSAVITENETGQKYAVDSWFHDNGHPPEIIAFELWKRGWKPNKAPDKDSDL